ncbi:MAG: hypothetical protein K0V04_40865 [Deltaproteobacteria bacterium]|nr:hypothetical protein [Deltaproteobacteria bacterium]
MGGSKAGIAGGIFVTLGLGSARFVDDCGRVGARGARFADEVGEAGAASRTMRWGPDGAPAVGSRGAKGVPPRLHGIPNRGTAIVSHAGEGTWAETLFDIGGELVTLDIDLPDDGEAVALPTVGDTRCPRVVAVTSDPEAWDGLMDGLGVACAPVIVVGTATPDRRSLLVGDQPRPLTELARDCAALDARCAFVGCPGDTTDACERETRSSLRSTPLEPSLGRFAAELVRRVREQPSPPTLIAHLARRRGKVQLAMVRLSTD